MNVVRLGSSLIICSAGGCILQILVINGSARVDSTTRKVSLIGAQYLKEHGASVSTFDVGLDMLPIFTQQPGEDQHPNVKKLRDLAKQADGFLILTPEYHSAMSGALKNALDFLGFDYFHHKPASIAVAAGGGKGGINACNNLRIVIRGVGGLALPQQVVFDPTDVLVDGLSEIAEKRYRSVIDELYTFTKAVASTQYN